MILTVQRLLHIAPAIAVAALILDSSAKPASAQFGAWYTPQPVTAPSAAMHRIAQSPTQIVPPASVSAQRGQLARLIRNPDVESGLPPFALTDQAGTIQRYVEPVEGIELEPYVGEVVLVRHDTGRTLLASQLELPPRPLLPLLSGEVSPASPSASARGESDAPRLSETEISPAELVQYADNDDSTTELLPEKAESSELPPAEASEIAPPSGPAAGDIGSPFADEPISGPMAVESGPIFDGPMPNMPMTGPYGDNWDYLDCCPECGEFHPTLDCSAEIGASYAPLRSNRPPPARLFADFQINFLRNHLTQNAIGKLSEKYEFSPRLVVGFRDTGKLDGRARFWYYDRDTRVLGGEPLNLEFKVLDLEGTHKFLGRRSELILGAGLRLGSLNLTDNDGDQAGVDMLGMTFAADGRTRLCSFKNGLFTWIYGGRLSILGGDWGGDPNSDFVTELTQDDNIVVHELHAGLDYAFNYRQYLLHARLGFEMQNWRSDVLAQNSISLLGPGIVIGAEY